jgi:hypothetical protein
MDIDIKNILSIDIIEKNKKYLIIKNKDNDVSIIVLWTWGYDNIDIYNTNGTKIIKINSKSTRVVRASQDGKYLGIMDWAMIDLTKIRIYNITDILKEYNNLDTFDEPIIPKIFTFKQTMGFVNIFDISDNGKIAILFKKNKILIYSVNEKDPTHTWNIEENLFIISNILFHPIDDTILIITSANKSKVVYLHEKNNDLSFITIVGPNTTYYINKFKFLNIMGEIFIVLFGYRYIYIIDIYGNFVLCDFSLTIDVRDVYVNNLYLSLCHTKIEQITFDISKYYGNDYLYLSALVLNKNINMYIAKLIYFMLKGCNMLNIVLLEKFVYYKNI